MRNRLAGEHQPVPHRRRPADQDVSSLPERQGHPTTIVPWPSRPANAVTHRGCHASATLLGLPASRS